MISVDLSALKRIKPHEYAVRFLFGGLCTALAGAIAKHYGPGVGGLFLAFPAIFPAGACLVESHETERKARAGMDGTIRGRVAAGVDAVGASLASIALGVFALAVWTGLPRYGALEVIASATGAWVIVAASLWGFHRSRALHRKTRAGHAAMQVFRRP